MKHDWIKSLGITVCMQCGQVKTKVTNKHCKPKQHDNTTAES